MSYPRIKSIAEGAKPFEPFGAGDGMLDEEGEFAEFVGYSSTGTFGHFRYSRFSKPVKMPLAGLRRVPAEECRGF